MSPRQQLAQRVRQTILAATERRPITELPQEGTVSVVDNGTPERWGSKNAAAVFKGGRWCRANGSALAFEPTVWIALKDKEG